MSIRRLALAAVGIAVVAYLGAIGYLVANEAAIVFKPPAALGDARPRPPFESIDLRRADGTVGPLWIVRRSQGSDAPWAIFLHGNGSTIGSRLNVLHYERLRELGLNVAAPEYRGYAGTGGVPTEPGLDDDARSAYEYLTGQLHVPPDRIVVYGWSLGSGVAVDLSSRMPEAAVVLEGAPASLIDIGRLRYPFIPVRLLMRNPFESIAKVTGIRAPVLFLHSRQDEIVPISEARRLFDAVKSPKQFVEVSGGHRDAAERDPAFFPAVQRFLQDRGVLR